MIPESNKAAGILDNFCLERSRGRAKGGKVVIFLRPALKCRNRSWRISGVSVGECIQKAESKVKDRFYPLMLFKVDGLVIAANGDKTARLEYDRICEREKIGREHPVELIDAFPMIQ